MKKQMLRSGLAGVSAAVMIFCAVGVVFDVTAGGHFTLNHYQFTKMLLGAVAVGLGFGLPAAIYKKAPLPRPLQFIFHMGIGCAVLLAVGFGVGWIPTDQGIGTALAAVAGELAVAAALWFAFDRHYRKEAEAINARLQARQKDQKK